MPAESTASPGVGINIPVLNEVFVIRTVLDEICGKMVRMDYTVCIVDGGSTDGTLEIIRVLAAQNKSIRLIASKEAGSGCCRGKATRTGLEWLVNNTKHEVFVEIDADGAQSPDELLTGIKLISDSECDIAIASKYMPASQVEGRSGFRNTTSFFMNLMSRMLISRKIKDYSNTYRFFNRRAAEAALKHEPVNKGPLYLFEILVIWISNGFTIKEFPTTYIEPGNSISKVMLLDFLKSFFSLLGVVFRYRQGFYKLQNPG